MSAQSPFLNLASHTFSRELPFKIYRLDRNNFLGTPEHTHDYMQIWYVLSGSCSHHVHQRAIPLTKGDLFVLPPFVTHRVDGIGEGGVDIIGCEFSTSFIVENVPCEGETRALFDVAFIEPFLVGTDEVRPRLHLDGKLQSHIEALLIDMLDEFRTKEKYHELHIKADLLKLLALVARAYERAVGDVRDTAVEKYRDAIARTIAYIQSHYTEKITMQMVCHVAMMSQTHFSWLFKQFTGKTMVEYVNAIRLQAAIGLLRSSSLAITEICYASGFKDPAYFNRVFKKETGLSPGSLRALSLGNTDSNP